MGRFLFFGFLPALGWVAGCSAFLGIATLGRKLEFGIGRFIFTGVPPILLPRPFSMNRNAVSAATTGGTHEIAD